MIIRIFRNFTASRKRLVITSALGILFVTAITTVIILITHKHTSQLTITITNTQLQQEIAHRNTFYKSQHNSVDPQTLRSDVTRQLASDKLVLNYAKAHNITVSDKEVDNVYQQRTAASGSEQQLLDQLTRTYGLTQQQYRSTISLDIMKDKVQAQLGKSINTWLNEEIPHYRIVVTKQ